MTEEELEEANKEADRARSILGMTPGPRYLGEFPVDPSTHPYFKDKTKIDHAKEFIVTGLLTDCDHHKQWALNQALLVLCDTPVEIKERRWEDGQQTFDVVTQTPSASYRSLLEELKAQDYTFDEGIPP